MNPFSMPIRLKIKFTTLLADDRLSEILTGSAWALSARGISAVLGLLASVIIARFYGAEALGVVAVVHSSLILTSIFTVMGTNTSILRLIPEHIVKFSLKSAFQVYKKVLFIVGILSISVGLLLFLCSDLVASKVFSKPYLSYYFILISFFLVFKSFADLNTQAVRGLKLIKSFSVMLILPTLGKVIFLIVLGTFFFSPDVPVYAVLGGVLLTGVVGCAIVFHAFRSRIQSDDLIQSMPSAEILSISFPMLLSSTMAFAIGQTGILMLGMFRGETEVGYYSIAVKLATLTTYILNAVNSIAAPKMSELYHQNHIDDVFYVAKKSAKLVFWLSAPILIGFIVFGRPILRNIYGVEFVVAYLPLTMLIVGQFINSISGATGLFMNMTGKHIAFRNIMVISGVSNVVLNLILIPVAGVNGAAFSAMLSLIAWNVGTLIYLKFRFKRTTAYFPMLS